MGEIRPSCNCSKVEGWCERHVSLRGFFFLMIRRPPRSTQSRSSAASDVYKRQFLMSATTSGTLSASTWLISIGVLQRAAIFSQLSTVSYTHLRAHETPEHLVCRLLLEKKNHTPQPAMSTLPTIPASTPTIPPTPSPTLP